MSLRIIKIEVSLDGSFYDILIPDDFLFSIFSLLETLLIIPLSLSPPSSLIPCILGLFLIDRSMKSWNVGATTFMDKVT